MQRAARARRGAAGAEGAHLVLGREAGEARLLEGARGRGRNLLPVGELVRMRARGVEFTQEPVDRYGAVDASFRDPSGNGWKMIEARSAPG